MIASKMLFQSIILIANFSEFVCYFAFVRIDLSIYFFLTALNYCTRNLNDQLKIFEIKKLKYMVQNNIFDLLKTVFKSSATNSLRCESRL